MSRNANEFARCPKCQNVIHVSSETCRFCGLAMEAGALLAAAVAFTKSSEEKGRKNDRRALISGIIGLVTTVLWFFSRIFSRARWLK